MDVCLHIQYYKRVLIRAAIQAGFEHNKTFTTNKYRALA